MKKFLSSALILVSLALLLVSCNDGEEGLFQMAASSVRKEAYSITQIVNKKDADTLIVSTDHGIAEYNVSARAFSDFRGTGVMATNVIWTDTDGDSFVWYDTKTNKYYNEDKEEVNLPDLTDRGLTPHPFHTPDGVNFTYVFIDEEGSYYSYYSESAPLSASDIVPSKIDFNLLGASIIGKGYLRLSKSDKTMTVYDCSIKEEIGTADTVPFGFVRENNIIIDKGGKVSILGGQKEPSSDTEVTRLPAMFVGEYTYIIVPKYNKVLQINIEKGEPTLSNNFVINGLQNVEVISIIGESGRKLQILTSNSGVRTIDMDSKTII